MLIWVWLIILNIVNIRYYYRIYYDFKVTSTNVVFFFWFSFKICHHLLDESKENFFWVNFLFSASTKGFMSEWTATSDLMLLWNSSGDISTCNNTYGTLTFNFGTCYFGQNKVFKFKKKTSIYFAQKIHVIFRYGGGGSRKPHKAVKKHHVNKTIKKVSISGRPTEAIT